MRRRTPDFLVGLAVILALIASAWNLAELAGGCPLNC